MKYFFPHEPYGRQKLYVEKLMKGSLERLAHLIKVCGLLLQTKVYLFWRTQVFNSAGSEKDYFFKAFEVYKNGEKYGISC